MSIANLIVILTGLVGYTAYCGSVFLTEYYEAFGVQLQFINITADHYLVRGLDIIRRDLVILLAVLLLLLLTLVALASFSFRVFRWKLPKLGPLVLALPLVVLFVDARISRTAKAAAVRDTFAETTALRQLKCLRTENTGADAWVANLLAKDQKLLILFRSQEQVIVFREPPLSVGRPAVDAYYIVTPDAYEIRTSSARSNSPASRDHDECFGR